MQSWFKKLLCCSFLLSGAHTVDHLKTISEKWVGIWKKEENKGGEEKTPGNATIATSLLLTWLMETEMSMFIALSRHWPVSSVTMEDRVNRFSTFYCIMLHPGILCRIKGGLPIHGNFWWRPRYWCILQNMPCDVIFLPSACPLAFKKPLVSEDVFLSLHWWWIRDLLALGLRCVNCSFSCTHSKYSMGNIWGERNILEST